MLSTNALTDLWATKPEYKIMHQMDLFQIMFNNYLFVKFRYIIINVIIEAFQFSWQDKALKTKIKQDKLLIN